MVGNHGPVGRNLLKQVERQSELSLQSALTDFALLAPEFHSGAGSQRSEGIFKGFVSQSGINP
jgi:hypothetical protein